MSDSIDDLIKELTEKLNSTSVVVTHDMYSVKNIADRVAMMHEGKIHFSGTPSELISSKDPIIKEFIQRTE
jgi:phospholipid/cholesterol/gamma-HCH transport system ATP-binding protein